MTDMFRDFEDDLLTGNIAEKQIHDKFEQVFIPIIERIIYDPNNKESVILQKAGVDGILSTNAVGFDIKCRRFETYKYDDILLETVSIREHNIRGWLYKSDVVVYVWHNISKTSFIDGYILYLDKIVPWFDENKHKFKTKIAFSKRNGVKWSTENKAVPINIFPVGSIKQIPRSVFNHCTQAVLANMDE